MQIQNPSHCLCHSTFTEAIILIQIISKLTVHRKIQEKLPHVSTINENKDNPSDSLIQLQVGNANLKIQIKN